MEPNRYRLRGPSLAQLGAQAVEKHGPTARIVSSERISATGVGRLLGRAYYEAVVEVGGPAPEGAAPSPEPRLLTAGAAPEEDVVEISPEALEASAAEPAAEPAGATPSERLRARGRLPAGEAEDEDFGRMMDDLWRALKEPGPAEAPAAGRGSAPIPMRGGALWW